LTWGNKHFAPEGPSVVLAHAATGTVADPVLVDRSSGRPVTAREFGFVAGPAADRRLRMKLAPKKQNATPRARHAR
jgi:hypothetical protein